MSLHKEGIWFQTPIRMHEADVLNVFTPCRQPWEKPVWCLLWKRHISSVCTHLYLLVELKMSSVYVISSPVCHFADKFSNVMNTYVRTNVTFDWAAACLSQSVACDPRWLISQANNSTLISSLFELPVSQKFFFFSAITIHLREQNQHGMIHQCSLGLANQDECSRWYWSPWDCQKHATQVLKIHPSPKYEKTKTKI